MLFRGMTIAITGCNRGIGLGLVKKCLDEGSTVVALARAPMSKELIDISASNNKCILVELDVTSSSSYLSAMKVISENGIDNVDAVIANAGIASKNHPVDPFMTCSDNDMMDLYKTNVIGTMFTLQHFTPLLRSKGLVMVMSSRLASIEQCAGVGGYLSYRCSKTALNMLAQTFAEEQKIKEEGIKVLAMHPGWVQTDMGGSGNRRAPVEIIESVNGIVDVLSTSMHIQRSGDLDTSISHTKEAVDFSNKLKSNNVVFVSYNFELLPY